MSGMNKADAIRALAPINDDEDWLIEQTGASRSYVYKVLQSLGS